MKARARVFARVCAREPSTVVLMLHLDQVMGTGFGVPRHPLFFLGCTSAPKKTLDCDAEAPNDEPAKVYCMAYCCKCLRTSALKSNICTQAVAIDKYIHALAYVHAHL